MDREDPQRQRSAAPRELRVDTDIDWTANQPSPRRVATAPNSPSTAYATDREAVFRSGNATVSETHVIRSSGSQSQSFTEEHWSSEITSFVATAPPKFIQVIKAYRVLNTDTPTLVVEVASEPPAIFEWFCNDKPVLQDKRRFQARHGLNITTLTVHKPDQGVYKCTARNPAGCSTSYGYIAVNFEHKYDEWSVQENEVSEERKVSLSRRSSSITYNQAPRFTTQVPNLTLAPGSEAAIDVEVDADPPARFSWFVNGREFRDSSDNVELYYPKENRCVARFSIPVSGQYKVVASNVHGSAMCSGYVEIYQANPTRQMRPPMPPGEHLARSMMTTSQHTGQTGGEAPAVTSKQSMSVYEVNYSQRSSSVPRGVRHLESHTEVATTPEKVFMSSSARNREPRSLHKTRSESGRYLPHPPKFLTQLPSEITVKPNEKLVLSVDVSALPTAEIKWNVNGFEVKSSKSITLLNEQNKSTLVLNPPIKQGKYNVTAMNDIGKDSLGTKIVTIVTETVEEIHSEITIGDQSGPDIVESAVTVTSAQDNEWEVVDDISDNSTTSFETVLKKKEVTELETKTIDNVVAVTEPEKEDEPEVTKETTVVKMTYTKMASKTTEDMPRKPAIISEPVQHVHVSTGETLVLESYVDSNPPSTFQWYVNNFEVKRGEFVLIEQIAENQSKATFLRPSAGVYRVVATNPHGRVEHVTRVTTETVHEEMQEVTTVTSTVKPAMFKLKKRNVSQRKDLPKPPQIVEKLPPTIRVTEGHCVSLKVTADAIPAAVFTWLLNNFELKNSNTVKITTEENKTEVQLQEPSAGKYEVIARNHLGQDNSICKVIVEYQETQQTPVVQVPIVLQALPVQTVSSTGENRFTFTVSGIAPFVFIWYLDTMDVSEYMTVEGNRSILILTEELREGNVVSVVAKNNYGSVSSQTTILPSPQEKPKVIATPHPSRAPVMVKRLEDLEITEGDSLVWGVGLERECSPCTFEWTLNHEKVQPNKEVCVDSTEYESIISITPTTQGGQMTVVAKNRHGSAVSSAILTVKGRDEPFEMVAPALSDESAPKIIVPLHSTTILDGQPMVLRCQIQATPSAAIVWSKDDVNVEEWVLNKDVTTEIYPDGVCELVNPESFPEDSGLYKCQASNPFGTAETSAFISVQGVEYQKDREEASISESFASEMLPVGHGIILPPKFVEPVTAETDGIDQLNYFRLVCRVVSGSPVSILWTKDGEPLHSSQKYEFFEFEDGTQILTIHEPSPSDNGVYTCRAESDHGLATTSSEVVLSAPKEISQTFDIVIPSPTVESPPSERFGVVLPPPKATEATTSLTLPTDEVAGITEIRKNEEEFKLLVKVADSVASALVANVFVDAVREAARKIIAEESSEDEELEVDGKAPRFDTSVEEYVATEGGSIRISTTVSGYPTPFVVWYLGEKQLKVTENLSMSYEKNVASLNLKDVKPEDTGTYYCHATNPHGTTVLSTKLRVVPKQPDMNIRTSLAKYDKNEADEKVVTNVFAQLPETAEEQKVNVLIKRSDSQTSFNVPKEEVDDFEIVKKSESSTPPDFEMITDELVQETPARKEETAAPLSEMEKKESAPVSPAVEKPQDVKIEQPTIKKEETAASSPFETVDVELAEEKLVVEQEAAPAPQPSDQEAKVIEEAKTAEASSIVAPEPLKQQEQLTKEVPKNVKQQPSEEPSLPKIIVPEEPPVPAPRTKKIKAEAAAAAEKAVKDQPVKEIDPMVRAAAEKFADSFTEKVLNQAQNIMLTFPTTEETAETHVVKTQTTIVLERDDESGRRSVTMPFEEKVKTFEDRLEAAASPDLSAEQAVNMMMETVMALKNQHISDHDLTVDVRNPDGRFDHVVTVVEPQVVQLGAKVTEATVPQMKFIDIDTILQKPSTSYEADCLLTSRPKRNANAEHRVIVLEGASQSFQNAMTWSLRKVQRLAEDEFSNMNIEVVKSAETGSQMTTVVDAEKIIPDLLQVAAAASKLKLINVTVSLVKRGDTAHSQLVIEYESQTDDDTNLNLSQLKYERPIETKEEMWSRRSRYSEEDERVAAVFVEVDATCPDQSVEIVATVNMPLEASAAPPVEPLAADTIEVQDLSRSVTETSGALQPPKFFRQLVDCQGVVGNPVQFKCIVSGTPTPQIIWSVDGDVIEQNHEYTIVYEDGVCILRINEIVSEDEGEYWCEAVNDAGRASTKCFLKVLNASWQSASAESASEPDSTELFEWEERRIQALIDRENEAMATSEDDVYPQESVSQQPVLSCSFNADLKEISAFHKYFETSETVVLITELYEIGIVEATVAAAPKPLLRRTSSTSTTEASFRNHKKNSFCVATTRLEKQNSLTTETATITSPTHLWNSDFENPFGEENPVIVDESRLYEPRTPLLPMKISYKGQELGVSISEVEKEESFVNKEGQLEVSKKTVLETSLEFNSHVENPKKISLKKKAPEEAPEQPQGDIAEQIDALKAETGALADAIRRAEMELDSLEEYKSKETPILSALDQEDKSMSYATSEAELIAILRSQPEAINPIAEVDENVDILVQEEETQVPKEHVQKPELPQEPPKTNVVSKKTDDDMFTETMKQIEKIARNVEHELAEISAHPSTNSGNELSDDAKSIEEAILMMSDRLVMQHPVSDAQAEASEELLRTTLADMILNPTRTLEEEIEMMKRPIRLLRRKISDIENSLMEDSEVRDLIEKEDPSSATTSTPATILSPTERLIRIPSAELVRMTPLTSNIKDQLNQLEDMITEHMENEATEEHPEPAAAAVKRRELHNIFTQINEEINTIRNYCSKKLTKKGSEAVMNVLHKVKTHVTSIVNVMSLAKRKRSKEVAAMTMQAFHFKKQLEEERVEGVITFKRHSLESSFMQQSSTQRSSAAISTSDDTWRYSKGDSQKDRNSRSVRDESSILETSETLEKQFVPAEQALPEVVKPVEVHPEEVPLPPPRRRRTQSADSRPATETPPVPPPRSRKKKEERVPSPKIEEVMALKFEEAAPSDQSMTMRTGSLDRKNFVIRKTSSEKGAQPLPPAPTKPKRSFAEGARGLFKNFKNPLKRKDKSKKSEEYEALINEPEEHQPSAETELLDELREISMDFREVTTHPLQEHVPRDPLDWNAESSNYEDVTPDEEETYVNVVLNNDEKAQTAEQDFSNVVQLATEFEKDEPTKWSEEEISSFYTAACVSQAFNVVNEMRQSQVTLPLRDQYSAQYATQMDDTYSVQMLCEESDYATDTDTSCLVKGSVKIFKTSPSASLTRNQRVDGGIIEEENPEEEGPIQDVVVNVELRSVDCDDAQSEAQYSFAEMLVYESDLDSEEQSHRQRSEIHPTARSDDTVHMVIDERQLSQISTDKIEEEKEEKISEVSTMRETDILSDESVRSSIDEEITEEFEFQRLPARKRLIATISQIVKQGVVATISEDLLNVIVEQEPEWYGLIIKVTEDQVDFTSLTVFTNHDDDISECRDLLRADAADFTETSSFDEYEVDDTKAGINVSIIARSLHDSIYASLEEIPWGEVQMTVKECDMARSVDSSVQFNVTVSENADERKSVRSQPSFKESQNSVSEENTLSNASINIPSYVIKLGSTATITCELNNYLSPNSRIEWVRGKKLVRRLPGKYDRISHDLLEVLIINMVDFEDQELYSLRVNDDVFPVAFLIVEELNEEEPAAIITPPQTQFVMEGQPTEICVQVTRNVQDVMWYKDKKPLSDTSRMATGFSDNFAKVIFGETKTADQGTYVATLGEQSVAITLVVEERIDEKEVTVVASGTESDDDDIQEYLVPPGSTATIACELEESDNRRSLTWIKDGRPLVFTHSQKLEHVVNGLKHYLVIHDTSSSDSGVYSVSISGTEFRVAHLVVNDLATSVQSLRRKRISNSSLNK